MTQPLMPWFKPLRKRGSTRLLRIQFVAILPGAKIGNDPGNRSDRLLVKGVTGSLDADQAWMNYFRYDAAKSANTQNLQTLPQSVISATDARQENR